MSHTKWTTFSVPEFSERWRHGGWYTTNRYPNGACGCVHNNHSDHPGKWFVAGLEDELGPFATRTEAALAERGYILGQTATELLEATERTAAWINQRLGKNANPLPEDSEAPMFLHNAIAKAKGESCRS